MDLLLTKYLKTTISYEGIQRVESFPMPAAVLREVLLNAIIHRDYAVPAPIQINPSVANVFFRAGEIEAWGRGIQRVFEACDEAGTPEPRIRTEPGDLWFEFPFSAAYLASVYTEVPGKTTQKTTQKTTREQVLDVLRNAPTAGRRAIAELLEDITEDGVKYHLDKLKNDGRIRRVGPDRGGHWEVLEEGHE